MAAALTLGVGEEIEGVMVGQWKLGIVDDGR